jgi:hypothetical protein
MKDGSFFSEKQSHLDWPTIFQVGSLICVTVGVLILAALTFQQGDFVDGGPSQYRRIFLTWLVSMLSAGVFLCGPFPYPEKKIAVVKND